MICYYSTNSTIHSPGSTRVPGFRNIDTLTVCPVCLVFARTSLVGREHGAVRREVATYLGFTGGSVRPIITGGLHTRYSIGVSNIRNIPLSSIGYWRIWLRTRIYWIDGSLRSAGSAVPGSALHRRRWHIRSKRTGPRSLPPRSAAWGLVKERRTGEAHTALAR